MAVYHVMLDGIHITFQTGHFLAFTLYALGRNPEVQQKLYNEVKDMTDSSITSGALESAQYMRAFLKESLRYLMQK